MRRLFLGLAVAATTLVPGVVSADDTQIADFIQTRLQAEQQQGRLSGFNVDMQVEQGTVWFKGTVSNAQQEMLILQTAQKAGHLGVVQVVDDIEVVATEQAVYENSKDSGESILKPVAYQQATKSMTPSPAKKQAMPASFPMPPRTDEMGGAMMTGQVITGEPLPFATSGEPMPMASAGMGMGAPSGAPNLPGYAWPGYAAHPNFGAVSYPRQYSASAWPYIGPFYPYPQVPLGWRKVSLEWDDGFWHLDFHDKSRH